MLARTLDARVPARPDRARDDLERGADAPAGGPPRDPERQAAAQGGADAGPPRGAVRTDTPRRDARGRRRETPPPDESISEPRAKLDERANQIRNLIETLDLLYDAFGQKRFGKDWEKELAGIQKWLKREERRAA